MAGSYQLDVSMALDDLGWHFGNWHHLGLARETLAGLAVLGADEEASIFKEALEIARKHWAFIGSKEFFGSYGGSPFAHMLKPLNNRLWRCLGYDGGKGIAIVHRWVPFAREHPELVVM